MSDADFQELVTHILTLGYTINFDLFSITVHEGHGAPGAMRSIAAFVRTEADLISPRTGRTLLRANRVWDGLAVTWESDDGAAVLRAHGSLQSSLPAHSTMSYSGVTAIDYRPRREPADGHGAVAEDEASIYASVRVDDLLQRGYLIPPALLGPLVNALGVGSPGSMMLTRKRSIQVAWHTPGIKVTLSNEYDVTTGVGIGMSAFAHRAGTDSATGVLTHRDDGTYQGTLHATVTNSAQMDLVLPLAADRCEDTVDGKQDLFVIARPKPRSIDRTWETASVGQFDGDDLVLAFYPMTDPSGTIGRCQGTLFYDGPATVGGHALASVYLPFNAANWNNPNIGYRIHLPAEGDLTYEDRKDHFPGLKASSVWTVYVTREE